MKRKSIFLVEDDIYDQEFFIEALSPIENTNVYGVANDGKAALAMLKNSISPPDHIFMDFNMPVMNGIECLTEIGKDPHTRDIPVVILSGSVEHADRVRKLGAGFIRKSADIQQLRTELDRIINLNITVNYVLLDPHVSVKYHKQSEAELTLVLTGSVKTAVLFADQPRTNAYKQNESFCLHNY